MKKDWRIILTHVYTIIIKLVSHINVEVRVAKNTAKVRQVSQVASIHTTSR